MFKRLPGFGVPQQPSSYPYQTAPPFQQLPYGSPFAAPQRSDYSYYQQNQHLQQAGYQPYPSYQPPQPFQQTYAYSSPATLQSSPNCVSCAAGPRGLTFGQIADMGPNINLCSNCRDRLYGKSENANCRSCGVQIIGEKYNKSYSEGSLCLSCWQTQGPPLRNHYFQTDGYTPPAGGTYHPPRQF